MSQEKRKEWWMNIKDKINLNQNRYCPPHYLPHKLPFGEPIKDEPCHIHKSKWRMKHHAPYCKKLKCPNYNAMIEFKKKYKENAK